MKRACAILALAAALPAAAQDQGWIIRFDQAEVTPADPVFWVECWAYFPKDDYAFAGARYNLHASEEGWGYGEFLLAGLIDPPPIVSGKTVRGIVAAQLNFPPGGIYADPANPIAVWRQMFEVTDFTARELTFHTETHMGAIYPERESTVAEQRPWAEGAGAIRVVPAPGAIALGMLGALTATRRRR
ncbi:MAG: hypothetical protein ACF8R7_17180 [Phycisphaerales bacterium JB039]